MFKLFISLVMVAVACFAAPYPSYGSRGGGVGVPVGAEVGPGSEYRGGYNGPYQNNLNALPGQPVGFPFGSGGYASGGYPVNAIQGGGYPDGYQGSFNGYKGQGGGYGQHGGYGQQGFGYNGQQGGPYGGGYESHGHDHGHGYGHEHNYGHRHEYGRGY